MLVLSRSPNQEILFPNVGISVHVLKVQGKSVRLGIEAPADVKILRPDNLNEEDLQTLLSTKLCLLDTHQLRNELNTLNLLFSLLQRSLATGQTDRTDKTISQILQKLFTLDGLLAGPTPPGDANPLARKMRLLVVEDDANERELLADLLRLYDFDVETAADGKNALEFLACRECPDFVLLDMRMPICDGPTTLRVIRESLRLTELPVFAVTGATPDITGTEDRHLHWFPKPLDTDRLVREMTRCVSTTQTTM